MHTMQGRSSSPRNLPRGAVRRVLRDDRGSEQTDYSARTSENVGRKVMDDRELIELLDEAIHTGREEMTDEAVIDYIGRLMAEREGKK